MELKTSNMAARGSVTSPESTDWIKDDDEAATSSVFHDFTSLMLLQVRLVVVSEAFDFAARGQTSSRPAGRGRGGGEEMRIKRLMRPH